MRNHIAPLIAGSLLIISVAACGAGAAAPSATPNPSASAAPTGAPGPTATPFPIRVTLVEPQACMDALFGGTLRKNPASGLGLSSADGVITAVEWPFRYTAREEDGRISLLDETGTVVAREGDEITVGGGQVNNVWYACGPVTVTRAAT